MVYFTKIDKMLLQTVNNHPVHILNNDGEFSPSSLIPFCSFGEELFGNTIDAFDGIPVCNIFKPKNYLDQLCYETDLQELKDRNRSKIENQLEMGLTLVLDYNEERQNYNAIQKNELHLMKAFYHNNDDSSIYLETISLLNLHEESLLTF